MRLLVLSGRLLIRGRPCALTQVKPPNIRSASVFFRRSFFALAMRQLSRRRSSAYCRILPRRGFTCLSEDYIERVVCSGAPIRGVNRSSTASVRIFKLLPCFRRSSHRQVRSQSSSFRTASELRLYRNPNWQAGAA